nr:MAG TPA: hypothetical protein [Caudoviricetes sp.]
MVYSMNLNKYQLNSNSVYLILSLQHSLWFVVL